MTTTKQILGGGSEGRGIYGVIVTFESESGQILTLHCDGPPQKALERLLRQAEAKDPTFKVGSYSNPQSIYGDLVGSRANYVDETGHPQAPNWPEAGALARIHRLDALHPRLAIRKVDQRRARERQEKR
jgi:hypothetical protein